MSSNTWSHKIARVTVRPLLDTWVRPNHLTTLRLITGLAAVYAFALGARGAVVWGGVLFVLSCFLDRADGELARGGAYASRAGHVYDLISDAAVTALVFVGIGIGLRQGTLGDWALPMGVLAGISVTAIFVVAGRGESSGHNLVPSTGTVDADDFMYLVGPIAWFGWFQPFLIAAAIGAPLFLLWMVWQLRARRQAARGTG